MIGVTLLSDEAGGARPSRPESPAAGDGDAERVPAVLDTSFARLHPLKVLVVDDDQVNLKLISALVRRLGYEPVAATNGCEALGVVREEAPDCVLMDLQMPVMDGIESTERIRAFESQHEPRRPTFISALTANVVPADRQRCFDVGMNYYVNKPVKLALLADVLQRAAEYVRHSAS